MRQKVLPIVLPPDRYAKLERMARSSERDPVQQARWLLKQALDAGALPADGRLAAADPRGPGEAT
jgi:hypothetical protein